MRAVCIFGYTGVARWRQAVAGNDLPAGGSGLGCFWGDGAAARSAASMSIAFLGVRRASEVAALDLSEFSVDLSTGAVDAKLRRQKNDQGRAGQFAHIASLLSWEGPCSVRLLSGWMLLRKWLADRHDTHVVSPVWMDAFRCLSG